MLPFYVVHIAAGTLSLVLGYIALYSPKGQATHRRTGMWFVYTMLVMCGFGFVIAQGKTWAPVNGSAALMTAYLVITSLTTVRPPAQPSRALPMVLMVVAFAIGLYDLRWGIEAAGNGGRTSAGIPAFPFFLFGSVGVLASIGDLRVLRTGALTGTRRLGRHLWRMTFALWVATMSFFLGQAKVIPAPLRIYPLLAVPVVVVLVTLLYWMWRVRSRRPLRVTVRPAAAVAAGRGAEAAVLART